MQQNNLTHKHGGGAPIIKNRRRRPQITGGGGAGLYLRPISQYPFRCDRPFTCVNGVVDCIEVCASVD